ncbi:MAG: ATP-binding protein [Candidatus Krumholzibacteriota bacterium]|nr:ATP-binding protein [Candidatus Krumholzibacteriota bacterium]
MGDHVDQMILNIPSDFKFLGAVDAAIQDLAREFAFSQDAINDVSTALVEACSNAIEHGNKFSREKRVRVTLQFNGSTFTASVLDQGGGFDFQSLLDDDSPPDMMSERGRGLIIMKAFTDDLRFSCNDEGMLVELTKVREAVAETDGG